MTATEWTVQATQTVWESQRDPDVRWVVETRTSSGGGAVDSVNGKTGVVVLNASDVGAATTGDIDTAVAAHVHATDPHGDRAYTNAEIGDLADAVDIALAGKVDGTDPRLSDARTPTAHTHPIAQINASALADPVNPMMLVTGTDGVIDSAPVPSGGGGGVWQKVSHLTLATATAAVTFNDLEVWDEIEIRWEGAMNANATSGIVFLRANGDSGNNYSSSWLYQFAATVGSTSRAYNRAYIAGIAGEQTNGQGWSSGTISFSPSSKSGKGKTFSSVFVAVTSNDWTAVSGTFGAFWLNTTDPVASVNLFPNDGSFVAGSQFTVLGRMN